MDDQDDEGRSAVSMTIVLLWLRAHSVQATGFGGRDCVVCLSFVPSAQCRTGVWSC